MNYSPKFTAARKAIAAIIAKSEAPTDPAHSDNTLHWLLILHPEADEILQLAALAHDIERGLPNPLQAKDFPSYVEYKRDHAKRAAEATHQIAFKAGYTHEEAERLAKIIMLAEEPSNNSDANLVLDADSISFFDTNIVWYLQDRGEYKTRGKIHFMFSRASDKAKAHIDKLIDEKPEIQPLFPG